MSLASPATRDAVSLQQVNLVLLRHGSSTANAVGRFGGWDDVPLTPCGVDQARAAGEWLHARGFRFDVAFASVLRRAVTTAWHALDALDQPWIPLTCDWRLNERHYGALQGMKKVDAVERYGATRVQAWRRGYDERPPCVEGPDTNVHQDDPRYRALLPGQVPRGESLADTVSRVQPCWHELVGPRLAAGDRTLVVAHGNSIRALLVVLLRLEPTSISEIEIPNGTPLLLTVTPHAGAVLVPRQTWKDDWSQPLNPQGSFDLG